MPHSNDGFENKLIENYGLGFAVRFKHTLATQLEVTLHTPLGAPTLIKQPCHGYQTFYQANPTEAVIAFKSVYWQNSEEWTEVSIQHRNALLVLMPECADQRMFRWERAARATAAECRFQLEVMAERLKSRFGVGKIWLPEQVPTEEDVAQLIADPPDWGYFEGNR